MIIVSTFFVIFAFSLAISSVVKTCDRRPTEMLTPKSTNPHSFRVVFKGNADFYVPETTYTGKLELNNLSKLKFGNILKIFFIIFE